MDGWMVGHIQYGNFYNQQLILHNSRVVNGRINSSWVDYHGVVYYFQISGKAEMATTIGMMGPMCGW